MVLPGHIAGGYLATSLLLAAAHPALSPTQFMTVYAIGTLAGDGPDIDLLYFYIVHKFKLSNDESHRDYVTHAPLVWLLACLMIVVGGALMSSLFIQMIGWAILAGSWSHLILDSIETGVRWLWPFSNRRYSLLNTPDLPKEDRGDTGTWPYYWRFIRNVYIKSPSFYIEVALFLVAVYIFLK